LSLASSLRQSIHCGEHWLVSGVRGVIFFCVTHLRRTNRH